MCIYIYIYIYVYVCMYIYIYIYIYTYVISCPRSAPAKMAVRGPLGTSRNTNNNNGTNTNNSINRNSHHAIVVIRIITVKGRGKILHIRRQHLRNGLTVVCSIIISRSSCIFQKYCHLSSGCLLELSNGCLVTLSNGLSCL